MEFSGFLSGQQHNSMPLTLYQGFDVDLIMGNRSLANIFISCSMNFSEMTSSIKTGALIS
ncbi:hypothetical protein C4F51_08750 [Cellvibrio sp. KB43]|uniref:Uncharacterized protein n=1 Tax=Cellvibrio polysaccharolyticus TaxID=2082724 RepID=A0A928V727_9GAMM|nr:hypothetical protein [Cellvibrio polysaccharolyticus]